MAVAGQEMADVAHLVTDGRMTPSRWLWVVIATCAIVLAVVVGSFALRGMDSSGQLAQRLGGTGGGSATAEPQPALFSEADAEFVAGMIPHHEQALELVDLLEAGVSDGNTLALAQRMRVAQTGELEFLNGWQTTHADLMTGHHHAHALGMATPEELDTLATLSGSDAERAFLQLMIRHHQGAIDMATDRLKVSGAGAITEYARNVFADQSAEIARMQQLLSQLEG